MDALPKSLPSWYPNYSLMPCPQGGPTHAWRQGGPKRVNPGGPDARMVRMLAACSRETCDAQHLPELCWRVRHARHQKALPCNGGLQQLRALPLMWFESSGSVVLAVCGQRRPYERLPPLFDTNVMTLDKSGASTCWKGCTGSRICHTLPAVCHKKGGRDMLQDGWPAPAVWAPRQGCRRSYDPFPPR